MPDTATQGTEDKALRPYVLGQLSEFIELLFSQESQLRIPLVREFAAQGREVSQRGTSPVYVAVVETDSERWANAKVRIVLSGTEISAGNQTLLDNEDYTSYGLDPGTPDPNSYYMLPLSSVAYITVTTDDYMLTESVLFEIFRALVSFTRDIRRECSLSQFTPAKMGTVSRKKDSEDYSGTISVVYGALLDTSTRPVAPRLKGSLPGEYFM